MEENKRLDKNKKISQTKKDTLKRHKEMSVKSYTCKIQKNALSKSQKESINRLFLESKWLKNYILGWSGFLSEDEEYKKSHNIFNFDAQNCKKITKKDKDMKDIEVDLTLHTMIKAQIKQDICSNIKTISTLKKKGFQKSGGTLKFIKECNMVPLKKYGFTHRIKSNKRVIIANTGRKGIVVNGLKQFINKEGIEICNARLLRKGDDLYIQFIVYEPKKETKQTNGKIIGIDFGCSTSFTTSEGEKIDIKIQESERLKKLQKNFAKKKKGSKNFNKNKKLIQKEYQKISNKKQDLANKIAAKFYEYDTVVIQDEQLKNWQKSGHGKAVQHSILGRVKAKLKTKNNVYILDKFFPTTKLCRNCGSLKDDIKLSDREFICDCGVCEDRDIHAAKNMVHVYKIKVGQGLSKFTPVEINTSGSKTLGQAAKYSRRNRKVLSL